jgi:hypothetical protein
MPISRKRAGKRSKRTASSISQAISRKSASALSSLSTRSSAQLTPELQDLRARRKLFYRASLASLTRALPRALRVRIAKVQAKIQAFLTTPRGVELDQQTLLGMVPQMWRQEYERLQELVNTRVLNDIDPENANGDAWRLAARERQFA